MRTKHSLINLIVNVGSSIFLLVLGFLKVRFFINTYGSDINGMQLTLMQYITYFNVFELAYSLGFRQLMYKPLANNDKNSVLNIYFGAKKIFRYTGSFLFIIGFIFVLILPMLTKVSTISNVSTISTFLILFIPFILSYFMMGPNLIIAADQKEYKINIWIQGVAVTRMLLMIICILLKLPVITIFIIEGLQVFIANFIARNIALKNYPWLKENPTDKTNKDFKNTIKYTLAYRLSVIANNNTDNIIISLFYGFKLVSIYGSYSYFIEAINRLLVSVIAAPFNSFGNLFNDKSKNPYMIFMELYTLSSYLGTIIGVVVFIVMNQLVYYWIGDSSYILGPLASALFAINIFYMTQREPILMCRDTNGLFKEALKNSLLIISTKIILSIILGQYLEIIGILLATSISLWFVDFFYTPKLVYHKVFNKSVFEYYKLLISRIIIFILLGLISSYLWNICDEFTNTRMLYFLFAAFILGICIVIIVTIIYYCFYESFRNLIKRFLVVVKGRLNVEN